MVLNREIAEVRNLLHGVRSTGAGTSVPAAGLAKRTSA